MFYNNKYTGWYFQIIDYARNQNRIRYKQDPYESHHVLPNYMGGSNKSFNKVLLTYREHYMVHLLLIKMCILPDHVNKMKLAMMNFCRKDRENTTSRSFALARKLYKEGCATRPSYRKGIPCTAEAREKLRISNSNRKISDETRKRMSEAVKKRHLDGGFPKKYGKRSKEYCEKMKEIQNQPHMKASKSKLKGRKATPETLDKLKNKWIQRKQFANKIGCSPMKETHCKAISQSLLGKKYVLIDPFGYERIIESHITKTCVELGINLKTLRKNLGSKVSSLRSKTTNGWGLYEIKKAMEAFND